MSDARASGPLTAFATRIGRHTGIYAAGSFAGLVMGFASVAVVTRFLDPSAYGDLALLLFFASLLTIVYNLGSLQGTLNSVFGSTGEEDIESDDAPEERIGRTREALGTGLIVTFMVGALGTLICIPLAPLLSQLLLHDSGRADLVLIAATSGAFGSLWRLSSNVLRLERRPVAFIVLSTVRPVLVLGAVIPAVANGMGIRGAIGGTALGSGLAVVIALIVTRRSYKLAFRRATLVTILRVGMPYIAVIVAFWIVQNADLFLLSRFVDSAEVGKYRVATRIASVVSYFTSAFLMAWGPLRLTTLSNAAEERHGQGLAATLVLYYSIAALWLLVSFTAGADVLALIAPSSYGGVSTLIPLVASGFAAQGALIVLYRSAKFPGRRRRYITVVVLTVPVFAVVALVAIPSLGAPGAALSVIAAFTAGVLMIGFLSQRGPLPIPLPWKRLGAAAALAAGLLVAASAGADLVPNGRFAFDGTAVLGFPVLVVVLRVIPREHLWHLRQVLRSLLPARDGTKDTLIDRLDPVARQALELQVRNGWTLAETADAGGFDQGRLGADIVAGLREAAELQSEPGPGDVEIAKYLFDEAPVAERDAFARKLWTMGIDPVEVSALEEALDSIRSELRPRRGQPAAGSLRG